VPVIVAMEDRMSIERVQSNGGRRSSRRCAKVAALALAFVMTDSALRGAEAELRPNIVFFLSDDQNFELLGCAGHPILRTPNIDRLAASGVRFANAFVTTSICAASRASYFTGLYERTHRFTFGTPPISRIHWDRGYPARLRDAGYRTGFIGKFGVGVEGGTTDLFDVFRPVDRSPYFRRQEDGSLLHETDACAERAVEFIDTQTVDRPFLLSVSFNAPHAEDNDKVDHYPYPPGVADLYEDIVFPEPPLSDPAIFERQPLFLRKSMNRIRWYWRFDTPEKYQRSLRGYFRMISGVDAAIGRVLEAVERRGFASRTVVIFASDNGYYLGSRGFAGKWSHYEESLRIPLIIHDPRIDSAERGRVSIAPVLNIDVPATILELAGLVKGENLQGSSLAPWLVGRPPIAWRKDFFCEHLMEHADLPKWEGIRDERWVYARYFEQDPVFEFLHDLDDDPEERINFATLETHSAILARMRRRSDELRERYGGPYRKVR
jgi:arylsulfatase A-like enzyme